MTGKWRREKLTTNWAPFFFSLFIARFCVSFLLCRYTVKGNVFDAEGKPQLYIDGKWNDNLGYVPCDESGAPISGAARTEMWKASSKPEGDAYVVCPFYSLCLSLSLFPYSI